MLDNNARIQLVCVMPPELVLGDVRLVNEIETVEIPSINLTNTDYNIAIIQPDTLKIDEVIDSTELDLEVPAALNLKTSSTLVTQAQIKNAVGKTRHEHNQTVAASTWVIQHYLGHRPAVRTVDSGGSIWFAKETIIDDNTIQLDFPASFSGKSILT